MKLKINLNYIFLRKKTETIPTDGQMIVLTPATLVILWSKCAAEVYQMNANLTVRVLSSCFAKLTQVLHAQILESA